MHRAAAEGNREPLRCHREWFTTQLASARRAPADSRGGTAATAAGTRAAAIAIGADFRGRFAGMLDRLDGVLIREPERGREELRGILGVDEKIRLSPDQSGTNLWADYSLGFAALIPNAEIMVAGAC
jgi:hypothetical protein